MGDEKKNNSRGSQSIERALKLLTSFSFDEPEKTLTQLSREFGLNKSTTQRILTALNVYDFVNQDPLTKKYRLGIKMFELGSIVASQMSLRRQGALIISQLAAKFKETVHLSVLEGYWVLCLDKAEGSQAIRMHSQVGERGYIHSAGSGKLLAAYMDEAWIDKFVETVGLPRFTEHTITDPEKFKKHLNEIRNSGYSIDMGEGQEDIFCVAVPVRNKAKKVIAAISIAGPSTRVTSTMISEILPELNEAANSLSIQIGYSPDSKYVI